MRRKQTTFATMPSENAIMCAKHQLIDERMNAFDRFFDKVNDGEIVSAHDLASLKLKGAEADNMLKFLKKRKLV